MAWKFFPILPYSTVIFVCLFVYLFFTLGPYSEGNLSIPLFSHMAQHYLSVSTTTQHNTLHLMLQLILLCCSTTSSTWCRDGNSSTTTLNADAVKLNWREGSPMWQNNDFTMGKLSIYQKKKKKNPVYLVYAHPSLLALAQNIPLATVPSYQ